MGDSAEATARLRFAVIPTNGRSCLKQCVDAIQPQVDTVIIVDTSKDLSALALNGLGITDVGVLACSMPANISHWWNEGLDAVESSVLRRGAYYWDVAILNDDAIVPEGWMDAVTLGMDRGQAAAGCSGNHDLVLREARPVPLDYRMQGFAFVLRGEHRLRANEDLRWYFTDDYLDWESRKMGGMSMVRGFSVEHLYPNGQLTPELTGTIPADAQLFFDIYGMRPW